MTGTLTLLGGTRLDVHLYDRSGNEVEDLEVAVRAEVIEMDEDRVLGRTHLDLS